MKNKKFDGAFKQAAIKKVLEQEGCFINKIYDFIKKFFI